MHHAAQEIDIVDRLGAPGARRIVIAGGPRAGKSTLAAELAGVLGIATILHTDTLIHECDWSAAADRVAGWFDTPGDLVVEGVQIGRAIRKLLRAGLAIPIDAALWCSRPRVPLAPRQRGLAAGCAKVWREVVPGIARAGVALFEL
jgi:hypothetical protein